MNSDTYKYCSTGTMDSTKKRIVKRASNWTPDEELLLVDEVSKREGFLFGKVRGDGNLKVGELKSKGWQEITDLLNARFQNQKREIREVKKKYYNIKQRSKEKFESTKNPYSGGSFSSTYTMPEGTFMDMNDGRPNYSGHSCGQDEDSSFNNSSYIPEDGETGPHEGMQVIKLEAEEMMNVGNNSDPGNSDYFQSDESNNETTYRSRGRRRKLADLELCNLELDNKRLQAEILRINEEREVLSLKKEILLIKKSKLLQLSEHYSK